MVLFGSIKKNYDVADISRYNDITERYGLRLNEQQVVELLETRSYSLEGTGRVEFGSGVIGKLIETFRDSPYIWQENYAETMNDLVEMFYYYKSETLDLISDDDLIEFMKNCFDGKCRGSLELLKCRELDNMARSVRFGCAPNRRL